MLKIYFASAITNRTGKALIEQSNKVAEVCKRLDIIPLDPIVEEQIKDSRKKVFNSIEDLGKYWKRDKELIRAAHVLIDLTGEKKSEGVSHELGFVRYFLFKPCIRVWPDLGPSVARLEDDVITSCLESACTRAVYHWGTPWKRLKWKISLVNRCFLGYVYTRLSWFVDWI